MIGICMRSCGERKSFGVFTQVHRHRPTQRAPRLRCAPRGERVDPWESTKDRQVGTRRVFWHFSGFEFSRFGSESMLPPQAGNASR